jgi:hypothetical protein
MELSKPLLTVSMADILVSFLCRGRTLYPFAVIPVLPKDYDSPLVISRWSGRVSLRSLYKDSLEVIAAR